jgi:chromate transporter
MVKGLALAETTPGPLIMVVQFVAFLGAYGDPGAMNPWAAAVLGALITTWVTFVPCFIFIFLGAPYVERLRRNRALSAALAGITASVVGVIANLALFFALHTLFAQTRDVSFGLAGLELPVWSSVQWLAVVVSAVACVLVFRLAWSVPRVLLACAGLGVAMSSLNLIAN